LYLILSIPRVGDIRLGEGGLHEKKVMEEEFFLSRIPLLIPLITFDKQHPLLSTLRVEM
jgi:hypothetical protein